MPHHLLKRVPPVSIVTVFLLLWCLCLCVQVRTCGWWLCGPALLRQFESPQLSLSSAVTTTPSFPSLQDCQVSPVAVGFGGSLAATHRTSRILLPSSHLDNNFVTKGHTDAVSLRFTVTAESHISTGDGWPASLGRHPVHHWTNTFTSHLPTPSVLLHHLDLSSSSPQRSAHHNRVWPQHKLPPRRLCEFRSSKSCRCVTEVPPQWIDGR